jgi:predicted transcriptional regulator
VSRRFVEHRKQQIEQERLQRGEKVQPAKSGRAKTTASSTRWQTLNQFVDVVAPAITKTEVLVWMLLFRHATNGTVETSERRIATALQLTKTSAGRALRGLTAAGLVWPIYRSTTKAASSKYGVHPNPAVCMASSDRKVASNRAHDAPG